MLPSDPEKGAGPTSKQNLGVDAGESNLFPSGIEDVHPVFFPGGRFPSTHRGAPGVSIRSLPSSPNATRIIPLRSVLSTRAPCSSIRSTTSGAGWW